MKILFFGTPAFPVETLRAISETHHEIVGVITQPDKPRRRGGNSQPCAVKAAAIKLGLSVLPIDNPQDEDSIKLIKELNADVAVVIAYGRILKTELLELPRLGCYNAHGSLLPAYRGAAPVQWAIANGEKETGVTIFKLNEGVDTGEIVDTSTVKINDDDTTTSMLETLSTTTAELFVSVLNKLENGTATFSTQDNALATDARKLSKEDGIIDFKLTPSVNDARARAFTPWPKLHASCPLPSGKKIRLTIFRFIDCGEATEADGTVLLRDNKMLVSCGGRLAELSDVQPENGKRMDGGAFARGRQLKEGICLE